MTNDSRIIKPQIDSTGRRINSRAVAMTVFIAAAMLILACCQGKPVMSHARVIHIPASGWQQATPLTFYPEYDDSTLTYSLMLTIRHENSYRYRNLALVIDMVASDSVVNRKKVNMSLADEYGNWKGGGFGALYQDTLRIADVIDPGDARSVVVWQTMAGCDTLHGIIDAGLITMPL